jgi:hypothetical protein
VVLGVSPGYGALLHIQHGGYQMPHKLNLVRQIMGDNTLTTEQAAVALNMDLNVFETFRLPEDFNRKIDFALGRYDVHHRQDDYVKRVVIPRLDHNNILRVAGMIVGQHYKNMEATR